MSEIKKSSKSLIQAKILKIVDVTHSQIVIKKSIKNQTFLSQKSFGADKVTSQTSYSPNWVPRIRYNKLWP